MGDNNKHLILLVDDEPTILSVVEQYLLKKNYVVITALSSEDALVILDEARPDVIISDVHMTGISGIDLLKIIRKTDRTTPVIVTTGDPNMSTVMEAIHHGAQDYIVKPLQLTDLGEKISEVIKVSETRHNKHMLADLIALHSLSSRLSSTREYSEVLAISFHACMDALRADQGYIMLANESGDGLDLVHVHGVYHGPESTKVYDDNFWPEAKWAYRNNRAFVISNGGSAPYENLPFAQDYKGVTVVAPIRIGDESKGVIAVSRDEALKGEGRVELNLLEILASQMGTALNNVGLYERLNKKIKDLHFISSYAEQFVGIVEPEEVIRSFIETIQSYFDVDFVGAILVGKRTNPFLYWSKKNLSDATKMDILKEVITQYNSIVVTPLSRKNVRWEPIADECCSNQFNGSFAYTKVVPLIWDSFEFGAFVLKWERPHIEIEEHFKLLTGVVNQTRIALTNAKLFSDIKENYIRTIKALAIAVDAKDNYTHGHSENVMLYSEIVARYMQLPEEAVHEIRDGGLLHDIGKIGIPGTILNKPGPLTEFEFHGVMKTHPAMGADIIKDVPFLQSLKPLILYHHEHHDGSGYPEGLKGDQIPIGAQIIHIADAFEAMTSNRPYRFSLGNREAVKRLREASGTQFSPHIVEQFIEAMVEAGKISKDEIIF